MPRRKRDSDEEDEEDVRSKKPSSSRATAKVDPDEDEDGSSEPPKIKQKSKTSTAKDGKNVREATIETNAEGDKFIKLSEYRRITVRTFKGKTLIDIRETYKDKNSGEMKPGAKGISLNPEQWEFIKANIANVDDMIASVSEK
ncbi:hypothetical protein I316_01278 [Kwoniella heveanensis BCC8398]|uniref:Transcriptional coactivator p15 (PC4) C-terminal domain-containing protein n=1 Tax=Kwoniella heveanensis BCC8398 TaxID=1296120 RepID=A0A1B9H085_9TREE|nr:hypothetical protein I316_01278 [Kwoniella heveanensis BCC8398]